MKHSSQPKVVFRYLELVSMSRKVTCGSPPVRDADFFALCLPIAEPNTSRLGAQRQGIDIREAARTEHLRALQYEVSM